MVVAVDQKKDERELQRWGRARSKKGGDLERATGTREALKNGSGEFPRRIDAIYGSLR